MKNRANKRQAGITLIEMLVVLMIIGLFAALVAPRLFKKSDTARVTAARAQINSFMTALGAYKLDTGTFWPIPFQAAVRPVILTDRAPAWNCVVSDESVPAPLTTQLFVPPSMSAFVRKLLAEGVGVLVRVGVGPMGVLVRVGVVVGPPEALNFHQLKLNSPPEAPVNTKKRS